LITFCIFYSFEVNPCGRPQGPGLWEIGLQDFLKKFIYSKLHKIENKSNNRLMSRAFLISEYFV
jgi:hypothetical protein